MKNETRIAKASKLLYEVRRDLAKNGGTPAQVGAITQIACTQADLASIEKQIRPDSDNRPYTGLNAFGSPCPRGSFADISGEMPTPALKDGDKFAMGRFYCTITKIDKFGATPHYGFFWHSDDHTKIEQGWMPCFFVDNFTGHETHEAQAEHIPV